MPCAEPIVEGNVGYAVICGEVSMVQVVEVVVPRNALFARRDEAVESRVAEGRGHTGMHEMENRVDRVGGNHPMQKNTREIKDMLDRMHRQPGPWPDIDVLVVQIMGYFV